MSARMRWRAPVLLVALLVWGCRWSAPATSRDAQAAATSTHAGLSVWTVDFMTIRPGEHDRYRRFVEANWAKARRTARERGLIRSYQALFSPETATAGFHAILLTEYPDSAADERREEIVQPILTAQGRTLIDGKATRELTSKVENHSLIGVFGAP